MSELTKFEQAFKKGMGSFYKSKELKKAEQEIERLEGICRAHGIPFAATVAARVVGADRIHRVGGLRPADLGHIKPDNKG